MMRKYGLRNGAEKFSSAEGRILISKLKICEETFFIVNIYAPTDYRDQNEFIKILSEFLVKKTDTSRLVIAGDWNRGVHA